MSDTQTIMKFELLPNEILFQCFGYLNAIQIFHSFNQLNYRFNKLIQNISLHLDFRNIRKLLFDQFCNKMLSNEETKKRIYSLHLSNKNISYSIQLFLSMFSLNKFPNLQSLTLTDVGQGDLSQLTSMLPLIPSLSCFRLIEPDNGTDEIFSVLPTSQLRTLEIPYLPKHLILMNKLSSITNLTVAKCFLHDLCLFFKNASSLKYLKLEHVSKIEFYMMHKIEHFPNHHAINLKHLIMMEVEDEFEHVVMVLKRTPNLKSLLIDAYGEDMIDACKWEDFITSSLPYLNIFKFKFGCPYWKGNNTIHKELKQFRNDFWCKQHHWYTEYSLSEEYSASEYSASIYTIPYIFDTYRLTSDMNRYCNELVNSSNTFDSVTGLIISSDAITEKCQYRFDHVTSLEIDDIMRFSDVWLNTKHIEHLKMIVNLFSLKHLGIHSHCKLETPSVLLELLKEASQVSSLDISSSVLLSLFDDSELWKYLNKMITKLHIYGGRGDSMDDSCDLNQFCKTFSNIEQLTCDFDQRDSLFFILEHLPKLLFITVFSFRFTCDSQIDWLEECHVDGRIISDFHLDKSKYLSIWITKDIC